MLTSIHPDTKIGTVALTISNLDRELAFYQDVLGFQVHRRAGDTAYLGAGGPNLLVLTQHPGAELVSGTTGLHHFAILLPSRLALASTLRHLGETGTPLYESYNHWCSESIYVADPDGSRSPQPAKVQRGVRGREHGCRAGGCHDRSRRTRAGQSRPTHSAHAYGTATTPIAMPPYNATHGRCRKNALPTTDDTQVQKNSSAGWPSGTLRRGSRSSRAIITAAVTNQPR